MLKTCRHIAVSNNAGLCQAPIERTARAFDGARHFAHVEIGQTKKPRLRSQFFLVRNNEEVLDKSGLL